MHSSSVIPQALVVLQRSCRGDISFIASGAGDGVRSGRKMTRPAGNPVLNSFPESHFMGPGIGT